MVEAVDDGKTFQTWGRRLPIVLAIVLITVALALWQLANYAGLMRHVGEWQFARFGRFFPAATLMLALLLVTALAVLVLRLFWREKRDRQGAAQEIFLLARVNRSAKAMFLIAVFCALLTTFVAIGVARLPGAAAPRQNLDAGKNLIAAQLADGPTRASGLEGVGPTARFTQDLLIFRRTIFVVPVNTGSKASTLLVEVDAPGARADGPLSDRDGYLRLDAAPQEVVTMYQGAGYDVADGAAVLYRDADSARWRPLMTSVLLLLATLIAVAFGYVFRRSGRRLEERVASQSSAKAS